MARERKSNHDPGSFLRFCFRGRLLVAFRGRSGGVEMIRLRATRTSTVPGSIADIPSPLRAEITLTAPAGATPDDVSRVLTAALADIAEDFGVAYRAYHLATSRSEVAGSVLSRGESTNETGETTDLTRWDVA